MACDAKLNFSLEGRDETRRLDSRLRKGAGVACGAVFLGGVSMAEGALFHHVRGLTSGGVAFAEENCAAPVTPRTHRTHARPC